MMHLSCIGHILLFFVSEPVCILWDGTIPLTHNSFNRGVLHKWMAAIEIIHLKKSPLCLLDNNCAPENLIASNTQCNLQSHCQLLLFQKTMHYLVCQDKTVWVVCLRNLILFNVFNHSACFVSFGGSSLCMRACTAPSFFIWMCVSIGVNVNETFQLLSDWRHSASLLWPELADPLHSAWIPPRHWHSACAVSLCVFQRVHACICVCARACMCVSECLCPWLALLIRADCLWQCFSGGICGQTGQINIWCDFTLEQVLTTCTHHT